MSDRVKRVAANVESGATKKKKRDKADQFVSGLTKINTLLLPVTPNSIANVTGVQNPKAVEKNRETDDANIVLSIESVEDCENVPQMKVTNETIVTTDVVSKCREETALHVHIPSPSPVTSLPPSSDPGSWERPCSSQFVSYWVEKGPQLCQNNDGIFEKSQRTDTVGGIEVNRKLTSTCFTRILPNGESVNREWLIYSPSTGVVFCFVCFLFSTETTSPFSTTGFKDWKNASALIGSHERNNHHGKCMLTYTERKSTIGGVDCGLVKQRKIERDYWIKVLQRVVATIKLLASRGLAFRGDDETFGSAHNGNFLGTLELIAQFDPFLEDLINNYGNAGRGIPSYLSSTICDELIDIMSQKVTRKILTERGISKYFSFSVDSTPDITHIDQLTFTLRYLTIDEPVERFLKFIPIAGHTGEYLCDSILAFLNDNGIDVMDARGQSYDNAANMSGRYNGVQAKFKEVNPKAEFVPCSRHSLNLVGEKAAECCTEATAFSMFLQKLYTFFLASPHRWEILQNALGGKRVVKSLSETRWSARTDASSALCDGYNEIQSALDTIADDVDEERVTRLEARSLSKKMEKLKNVIFVVFWNDALSRFNKVSRQINRNIDCSNIFYFTIFIFHFIKYR